MELVLIVTGAGLLGLLFRYVLPNRDRHGLAVMPAAGVIVGSLAWTLSIWVGLSPVTPWPWLITFGLAIAGVIALGIILPKRREAADAALWDSLTH